MRSSCRADATHMRHFSPLRSTFCVVFKKSWFWNSCFVKHASLFLLLLCEGVLLCCFIFLMTKSSLKKKLKAELQRSPGCHLGSPCWYRTDCGENKEREHWLLFGKGAYFLLKLWSSWSWHKLLQYFKLFSRRVAIHLGNLKEQFFSVLYY